MILTLSLTPDNFLFPHHRKFTVLTLHDGEQRDSEKEGPLAVEPVLKSNLFYPDGTIYHRLVVVKAVDILVIAHKTIQVESEKIIDNVKKREMPRFAMVSSRLMGVSVFFSLIFGCVLVSL